MQDPELEAYEYRQAQKERIRFRDRVAVAAMREMVHADSKVYREDAGRSRAPVIAQACYALADAMEAAREERSDGDG